MSTIKKAYKSTVGNELLNWIIFLLFLPPQALFFSFKSTVVISNAFISMLSKALIINKTDLMPKLISEM